MFKKLFLTLVFSFSTVVWSSNSFAADCSGASAAPGKYPGQYELSEYESAAGCSMSFSENPNIASINATIIGNGALGSVNDRLPSEPLVVVPYDSVGTYGGTFRMLSNATEAGTSDLLSTRHVNLVRYSDDLTTIVPNIAKDYEWNDDYTQLTFALRKGHKWSDGAPFTSADVKFWYDHLMVDTNISDTPYWYLLVADENMTVDDLDDIQGRFKLQSSKPGILAMFETIY